MLENDKREVRSMLDELGKADKSRPVIFSLVVMEEVYEEIDKVITEAAEAAGFRVLTRGRNGDRRIWRFIGKFSTN